MKSIIRDAAEVSREIENSRQRLIKFLCDKAFNYSPVPKFPLASGALSKYYIDCKQALSDPEARELVGGLIWERVRTRGIQAVAGLELGAVPIAIAVSDEAYRQYKVTIQSLIVRKQPKPHGLQKHIEGKVIGAERVLIVDDVITTGQSTISAIKKSQDAGLDVVAVVAILDRQESNGRANIESLGVTFDSLITLEELENAAVEGQPVRHRE
jgi:orotate phosphoribosyltransferase